MRPEHGPSGARSCAEVLVSASIRFGQVRACWGSASVRTELGLWIARMCPRGSGVQPGGRGFHFISWACSLRNEAVTCRPTRSSGSRRRAARRAVLQGRERWMAGGEDLEENGEPNFRMYVGGGV